VAKYAPRQEGGRLTRIELERSYRPLALIFCGAGLGGGILGLSVGEPVLMLAMMPALIVGLGLWRLDPREYVAIDHVGGWIRNERHQGRKIKIRREFRISQFQRLELVRYHVKRRGQRAMLVLVHRDGRLERFDDRPDKPQMNDIAERIAQAAGLPFVDKGFLGTAEEGRGTMRN